MRSAVNGVGERRRKWRGVGELAWIQWVRGSSLGRPERVNSGTRGEDKKIEMGKRFSLGPSREFLVQGKGLLGSFGIRGAARALGFVFGSVGFVLGVSLFGMSNLLGSFARFHFGGGAGGSGWRRVRD